MKERADVLSHPVFFLSTKTHVGMKEMNLDENKMFNSHLKPLN